MTYRYLNLPTVALDRTPVKVDRWYDRSLRVWTGYLVNAAGDQMSDTVHAHDKGDVSLDMAAYTPWAD